MSIWIWIAHLVVNVPLREKKKTNRAKWKENKKALLRNKKSFNKMSEIDDGLSLILAIYIIKKENHHLHVLKTIFWCFSCQEDLK